jgi:nicotinate-nucleotide--dimethylbenzimidazole phosphoribosyltransferase
MKDKTMQLPAVPTLDSEAITRAQRELDTKTKPPGSLGRLEHLAARYVAIRGREHLKLPVAEIVIMAADHGIAAASVSAYPQAVTEQMLLNFARGGAAINAIARATRARLTVVNVGVLGNNPEGVLDHRVRAGSRNLLEEEALTADEVERALEVGFTIAEQLAARGVSVVALGEMGIGNTTVASLLSAVFTGAPIDALVGRGTGLDDAALVRKRDVVTRALAKHLPERAQPLRVLAQVGGLEIIALAGLAIGAASRRIGVVLDGFIATSAALVAVQLSPNVKQYLFASHNSVEPGHRVILETLGLEPVLDLQLRLGEGTGAALALPLFEAGVRLFLEMATFASAGVSGRDD